MSCFCASRNPFDSQTKIVKRMVFVASCVLDGASNESHFGRQSDRFRNRFRRFTKALS